ncbi:MAG: hypothetical protein RL215_1123 [Planctomycetota bacterium]
MGVTVGEYSAAVEEEFEEFEGGAFAGVIDIFFVGHTEDADAAVADRFSGIIQKIGDSADDISGHEGVDFAGEFNEAGAHAIASCEPAEVEGVDGYAVSAEPWSGVEGLEAEGFGFGGINNFPDIDTHAVEEHFEFVDESDVYGAVGVFEDFAGFCDFGVVDADDFDDGVAVEAAGEVTGVLVGATDDFGDACGGVVGVTWVFAFGAEGGEVVLSAEQAAGVLIEDGDEDIAGGGGVGGAFEDDELSGAEDFGDGVSGGFDELEIGIAGLIEGSGDTDEQGISFVESGHIAGGIEDTAGDPVGDGLVGDMPDVAESLAEELDFCVVDVESEALEAGVGEGADERESDVAKSDDADFGGAVVDFGGKLCCELRDGGGQGFSHGWRTNIWKGWEIRGCFRRTGCGRLIERRIRDGGRGNWRWICGFGGIRLEESGGCPGEL